MTDAQATAALNSAIDNPAILKRQLKLNRNGIWAWPLRLAECARRLNRTGVARGCSRQNKTAAETPPRPACPYLPHDPHLDHPRRLRGDRRDPAIKCWRRGQSCANGDRYIWLDPRYVERLLAIRRPGESYSDVIPRVAKASEWTKKARKGESQREARGAPGLGGNKRRARKANAIGRRLFPPQTIRPPPGKALDLTAAVPLS